ncbi:hypothetical protein Patl1_26817 [Pistacia atlantica]|uniref:Uncharacterized protein n=1 Tax=Pistacia atlantica TaxID=434234 RepID=A0ACC1B1Z6_9ROSI|nr:hypothetical protein Patl1_26817 [Pistacia atlantica]
MEGDGGGVALPADAEMAEALPEPQQPPAAPQAAGIENIPATLSYGGRFIEYNIFGNMFVVTAKYKPPIMPIGKGAYGIVCSALNSETNEHVAIKKIANAFDNKIDAKRTLREIKLLRHMDHENVNPIEDGSKRAIGGESHPLIVVAIRDIVPPPERESFNDVYIAYELMDTDLHQIIRSNQALSEEHCQLLLNSSDYTAAIDVWSVGCIFMELMDRKPLFPGRDHVHQLRLLMELIGTPSEADIEFLNENAKRYIRQLPPHNRQSFTEKFASVHPLAIDLVEKMLTFDPRRRITVEDALAHPYLASLHDISDEPVCMSPFSFDFEQHALSEGQMKELIYQEALAFNPEYRHQ